MSVQPLLHEFLSQLARSTAISYVSFHFSPLVLEPDLDFILSQTQIFGQFGPAGLGKIAIPVELTLQSINLQATESSSRPFLIFPILSLPEVILSYVTFQLL